MIPEISLETIFSYFKKQNLKLDFPCLSYEGGNTSLYEQIVICSILRTLYPARILELGTFNGRTTINMAANTSGIIYTVDLPVFQKTKLKCEDGTEYNELGYMWRKNKLFTNTVFGLKISQIWCDTANLTFETFDNSSFDFIFIDASHSYEYCLNDSLLVKSFLKENGVIIWHDYNGWPGVTKAIHALYEEENKAFNKDGFYHIRDTSLAIYFNSSVIKEN